MGGEGGGVKYQCVVSSSARPTGDLARNPGPQLGIDFPTGNRTGDALVRRPALNPLSCTSPGKFMDSYFSSSSSSFIYLFIYFRVDQYSSLYLHSLLSFNIHILKSRIWYYKFCFRSCISKRLKTGKYILCCLSCSHFPAWKCDLSPGVIAFHLEGHPQHIQECRFCLTKRCFLRISLFLFHLPLQTCFSSPLHSIISGELAVDI